MAATMIESAFLSATVQTLVEKLASKEFLDYIKNTKLDVSLLKQLRLTLLTLQPVLDAAEEKQINTPSVKDWLDGLKDAVYDAEDLLNQISYDSLRCKMDNTQPASKTKQVWNFISSPFQNIYGEINTQMNDMCESLKLFAENKDILSLQTKSVRVSHRTPSSPMVNDSDMVGRTDEQEKVISMLLSESNTNMGVVAIVGMGGVGKTTLAQLAYNDKKVLKHFNHRAWACVSEDFDILRVTKTLLESVTKKSWETNNLDLLRVELKKKLSDRRFFIVLDDLWNDTHHDWEELVSPLIYGKTGSRVIITTRHKKVADAARTFPIFELHPLSDADSWFLLSKHAFGSGDFSETQKRNVEAIGRKIPTNGLPTCLQSLCIRECENLTFLPPETWSNYTSLKSLELQSCCNALTSFPLNGFPMLQHLSISECWSLESIFISETLPCRSSTLQHLFIEDCEALISLPQRMDTLTALQWLYLFELPNLNLSLCEGAFLPPNLQSIDVDSVGITKPVTEWGLHGLTVVSRMGIGGDDIVNMLLKELLLPISLVRLSIRNLSEIKSLEGNGLRHLSSLERLSFYNCSELVSLPEIKSLEGNGLRHLSSLEDIRFYNCPRLESLPEDSLPTSLQRLYISRCPLLEERYKRKENWSKIAHIPFIEINDQLTI